MVTRLLAVIAALSLFSSCSFVKDKGEAEKVAQQDFDALKTSDYTTALTYYSPTFFTETSKDDWLKILKNLDAKLGPVVSYSLEGWNVNSTTSGTRVVLNYTVKRTKYESSESLTLSNESGAFLIIGHHINSKGLLMQ